MVVATPLLLFLSYVLYMRLGALVGDSEFQPEVAREHSYNNNKGEAECFNKVRFQ